ncbi:MULTISPECIES: GFA family protein [unclassified Rhizobium]|uniref:GFA family protein n=1 Tax=unclassified Rhizobium TaxID=2613769 RepID=UPI00071240E0|nr:MULTISPECIES: GFA family protein [unclassified Rhizobium]KQS96780.1 aldehyde-activating protein [Rhizobium sp. Leaf386]KQT06695.1 aldehyde-activating protein [Rhizobium sp. Leaf391]KQU10292.1 aldehyde-activating protein [Rhizobium sp. Leaf453]
MDSNINEIDGACHCGTVRFHVRLTDGLNTARRCNCSYCRMRGAVVVSADLDAIGISEGEEALSLYQFNTKSAKHYFCSKCGIYTHHQRRSNTNQYGANVACLKGISPFDFQSVPVSDGVSHPADDKTGRGARLAGILTFTPSED